MKINYNSHALIFCLLASFFLFAALTIGVWYQLPFLAFDDFLSNVVRLHLSLDWLTPMLFITNIASPVILGSIVIVAYTFLLWFRKGYYDVVLVGSLGGGVASAYGLKFLLDIPRPEAGFLSHATASFPSGHATVATIVFLSLAYAFRHEMRHTLARWSFEVICFGLVAAIALSRVYLGAHRPSEVMAGFLLGVCWVTLLLLVIKPPALRLK